MRSISFLSTLALTSRAFSSPTSLSARDNDELLANARAAADDLAGKYDFNTGLWNNNDWWPSANALTILADLAAIDQSYADKARPIWENTFNKQSGNNYLNDFYDDEGWWALCWLQVYENTGDTKYLEMAQKIVEDMATGFSPNCGGNGLWWDKPHTGLASISNELFITAAAHLANLIPDRHDEYLNLAMRSWDWMTGESGVFRPEGTISDGLNPDCTVNLLPWTYNQGVILGGLFQLYKATGNDGHIWAAYQIANATVAEAGKTGILHEFCCTSEALSLQTGIFMRNLGWLVRNAPSPPSELRDFMTRNADAVFKNARREGGDYCLNWEGECGDVSFHTTTSAVDAVVAGYISVS